MKDLREVIKGPIITEKSSILMDQNKYTFKVDGRANKVEIKEAVEILFNVHVKKVRTSRIHGKPKQMPPYPPGYTPDWKKAIVKIAEGDEIDFFHEV